MDPIRELNLFRQIKHISRSTPSLFITHRIGAVTLADTIILLRHGHIETIGTLSELMERSPYFQQVWHSQANLCTQHGKRPS